MKENIELITAFLTFAGTLSVIILKEEKERKEDHARASAIQKQNQHYENISTSGNNSSINIKSVQTQISDILVEEKEAEIYQKNFSETYKITNIYLKLFILGIYILSFFLSSYFFNSDKFGRTIYFASTIFCVLSLALNVGHLYKFFRRNYYFSVKNSKEDMISKMFRKVQQFIYPIVISMIQIMLLKILFETETVFLDKISNSDTWGVFNFCLLLFLSVFWFYQTAQFSLLKNQYKVKFAYKYFFLSLICLVVVYQLFKGPFADGDFIGIFLSNL